MTIRAAIMKIVQQEDLNFLLTNRIPRRSLTQFMGWFSRIEHPLVRDISLAVWRVFSDLDLSDAQENRFRSLHHCFTRTLKDGARPVDADPAFLVSPCDGIVGASGMVQSGQVLQIKGFAYALEDLFGDAQHAAVFRDGTYVTLRLTSAMYHRFHAPHDCQVDAVTHIGGDRWNVNPVALRRVERLFCRNERALIHTTLSAGGHAVTLVAVAAILVSGIRLRFLDLALGQDHRGRRMGQDHRGRRMDQDHRGRRMGRDRRGRRTFRCSAELRKGEEMGWFEHGSTIVVFAPAGFTVCDSVREGTTIRVGQKLLRMPV